MKHAICIIFCLAIAVWFVFSRFYQLESRYQFTWDQIENAWVMKTMAIEKIFPLKGMEAKATSGFSIGPGYYYLLYPFYAVFNLNPTAGGIFAGVVSLVTVVLLYQSISRIAGMLTGCVTTLLYACSLHVITFDRIAWPVVLIPFVSLLIFVAWWNILSGNVRYYILLGLGMGAMFHVHVTALYFVLIALLLIPLLPWRATYHLRFLILGVLICFLLVLPMIYSYVFAHSEQTHNISAYISQQFHGLYFRRVVQLSPEMLIEFSGVLQMKYGKLLYPMIWCIGLFYIGKRWGWRHGVLICLWFTIPLLVMSLYKGEITQYYFATTRVVTIFVLGLLLSWLLVKHWLLTVFVIVILCFFVFRNVTAFFDIGNTPYLELKARAVQDVAEKKAYHFTMGDPYSYLHEWTVYSVYKVWPKDNNWLSFQTP